MFNISVPDAQRSHEPSVDPINFTRKLLLAQRNHPAKIHHKSATKFTPNPQLRLHHHKNYNSQDYSVLSPSDHQLHSYQLVLVGSGIVDLLLAGKEWRA